MKDRLIYWIDKVIYMLKDTMPDPKYEDSTEQKNQVEELEEIRKWIIKTLK